MPLSSLQGTGLLVLWGEVDGYAVNEYELNDWWTNEHLPERLAIPGFLHARRYYAPDKETPTPSKYLTLYEVASLDTLTSPAYMAALNMPTPRTAKWMPALASMNRSACLIVHSAFRTEFNGRSHGIGGTLAHITFIPPFKTREKEALKSRIIEKLTPELLRSHPSLLCLHCVERDEEATGFGSSTKSYEAVSFSNDDTKAEGQWIILVEFASPASTQFSRSSHLVLPLMNQLSSHGARDVTLQMYELICAVSE